MPYLSYQQSAAESVIRNVDKFTVAPEAVWVELQADTQNVRYTMDDSTNPTTSSGMVLLTTEPPKLFLIEDFKNIRYVRSGGTDGVLNAHFGAGRDI